MASGHVEAAAAAASLIAALQLEAPAADGDLLAPAVYAALSMPMDGVGVEVLCCSGNLLPPRAAASTLHRATASLAGAVLAQHRAKLLQCDLLPRRHRLEDVAAAQEQLGADCTVVCLPLLDRSTTATAGAGSTSDSSAAATAPALGCLTLGFSSPPTGGVLRRAVLVAHSLAAQHHRPLAEFQQVVAHMLLPQRPQRTPGSDAHDSGGDSDSDGGGSQLSFGEWHAWELGSPRGSSSSEGGDDGPLPGVPQNPLSLRFADQRLECEFGRFSARQLQRMDGVAHLLLLCLLCLESFSPIAHVIDSGHWRAGGVPPGALLLPGLLPGLLLARAGTAALFSAHREGLLLGTWAYMALVGRALLQPGWVAVLGLALPLRWWRQAPLSLLLTLPALRAGRAALARSLCAVALPLACGYAWERHMRRSFLRGGGRTH